MTLSLADAYYRVEVDAGAHSWVTENGDAPGYGLADPLTVSWSNPNSPLFHPQPDAMRATFKAVVPAMSDLADVVRGTPVVIRVWGWPPGTANPYAQPDDLDPVNYPPIVVFRGRVADVDADPHKLGMIFTFSCVDYSVDLAEQVIGAGDWPSEGNDERLLRMFDEAGELRPPPSIPVIPAWFVSGGAMAARTGSPADARSLIWELADWATGTPDDAFGFYHYLATLYANYLTDDAPDPLGRFGLLNTGTRLHTGDTDEPPRLPAVFGVTTGSEYGVLISEDTDRRAAVISADHVDFSARWSQTKRTDPDTFTVTGAFVDGLLDTTWPSLTVSSPGAVPVTGQAPFGGISDHAAINYATANLAGADSDRWQTEPFTWYADQDPWPLIADGCWFIEGKHVEAGRYPVVVAGIDPTKTPNGLDWWAGRLRSATFALAGGHYTVRFELARNLLRPGVYSTVTPTIDVATLTPEDLATSFPAVKVSDADPAYTPFDYRLVRSP